MMYQPLRFDFAFIGATLAFSSDLFFVIKPCSGWHGAISLLEYLACECLRIANCRRDGKLAGGGRQ
ncbi:MAG: hypothetical protein V3R81_07620, partial [Gammaproteobacteria bacterium]